MKTFTFRYEKNPKKNALTAMSRAIKSGHTDIKNDELVCDSVETMLKIMSKSRFEVFAAILETKPNSLYELARTLEKDQANVLRDAKALAAFGLITLIPVKDRGRDRLKPQAIYEKIVIEFAPRALAKAV